MRCLPPIYGVADVGGAGAVTVGDGGSSGGSVCVGGGTGGGETVVVTVTVSVVCGFVGRPVVVTDVVVRAGRFVRVGLDEVDVVDSDPLERPPLPNV
jgi:hypothetical protein